MKNNLFLCVIFFLFCGYGVKGEEVDHTSYSISYSPSTRKVEWVRWQLMTSSLDFMVDRSSSFSDDPKTSVVESTKDYTNSGYDRGHLCPAGDMKYSMLSQKECFYLSNIVPQTTKLNRGLWKVLENQIRCWASEKHYLIIMAGAIYPEKTVYIGATPVPSYCWKVIFCFWGETSEGIGFLFPNTKTVSGSIQDYVVSIKYIEDLSGIKIRSFLPSNYSDVGSTISIDFWFGQK